jgi:hypothetical protein
MKRLALCAFAALSLAACGPSPGLPEAPPASQASMAPPGANPAGVDEATLMQWAAECDVVIGLINSGVARIESMPPGASSDGAPQLEAMASALENVAAELEKQTFTSPDLARLGGFYVGLARALATSAREMEASVESGDAARIQASQTKLDQLTVQEDAIVDEINAYCGPP